MAQWIPKTAWKISNLNKRYGPQYAMQPRGLNAVFEETQLQGYTSVMCNLPLEELKSKVMSALESKPLYAASVTSISVNHSAPKLTKNEESRFASQISAVTDTHTTTTTTSTEKKKLEREWCNTNEQANDNFMSNNNKRKNVSRNYQSETMVIDVRDDAERLHCKLAHGRIYALHPHDLLSGAALPLLPLNKTHTEMFVIVTSLSSGRAVQTCTALRRWGYHNLHVVEAEVLSSWLMELLETQQKMESVEQSR